MLPHCVPETQAVAGKSYITFRDILLCDDNIQFTCGKVNFCRPALSGIAIGIELAPEGCGLLGAALSRIQTDEIPPRPNWLRSLIVFGVESLENAATLGLAIRAGEVILSVRIQNTSLGIVEKV